MKVDVSGFRDGSPWPGKGGEIVVPDVEGAELCAQGMAEPVAEVPKAESASAPKPSRRSSK